MSRTRLSVVFRLVGVCRGHVDGSARSGLSEVSNSAAYSRSVSQPLCAARAAHQRTARCHDETISLDVLAQTLPSDQWLELVFSVRWMRKGLVMANWMFAPKGALLLLAVTLALSGCASTTEAAGPKTAAVSSSSSKAMSLKEAGDYYEAAVAPSNTQADQFYAAIFNSGPLENLITAARGQEKEVKTLLKKLKARVWPESARSDINAFIRELTDEAGLYHRLQSDTTVDQITNDFNKAGTSNTAAHRVRTDLNLQAAPSWYPLTITDAKAVSDSYAPTQRDAAFTVRNDLPGKMTDIGISFAFEDAAGTIIDTGSWGPNGATLLPGQSVVVTAYMSADDPSKDAVTIVAQSASFTNQAGDSQTFDYETADQRAVQMR